MNILENFLDTKTLNYYEVYNILDEWKEFQKEGMIGDCELRKLANEFGHAYHLLGDFFDVVHWMREIVMILALRVAEDVRDRIVVGVR